MGKWDHFDPLVQRQTLRDQQIARSWDRAMAAVTGQQPSVPNSSREDDPNSWAGAMRAVAAEQLQLVHRAQLLKMSR